MKTVAVTLDQASFDALDRMASRAGRRSRSAVVREAVLALSEATLKAQREERERQIFRAHRTKIGRQARALIKAQARS